MCLGKRLPFPPRCPGRNKHETVDLVLNTKSFPPRWVNVILLLILLTGIVHQNNFSGILDCHVFVLHDGAGILMNDILARTQEFLFFSRGVGCDPGKCSGARIAGNDFAQDGSDIL